KGNALDMVPVKMRDQNVGSNSLAAQRLRQLVAKHAQAGAAIEDEACAVWGIKFETGRVAAVAPRIALERRRRAAHSPENQFGQIVRHRRANRDARRLRPLKRPLRNPWKAVSAR